MKLLKKTASRIQLDNLDIPSVISKLGLRIKDARGTWITAWCIFHDDGKNPNLRIRTDSGGVFRCFSCGAKGNILNLVERAKNLDREAAWQYLATLGKRGVTLEGLRRKLERRKNSNPLVWKQVLNQSLIGVCDLLLAIPPGVRAEQEKAHVTNDVNRFFRLQDPDYFLLRDLIDAVMVRMEYGCDADSFSDLLFDIQGIWEVAESVGYLERYPVIFHQTLGRCWTTPTH